MDHMTPSCTRNEELKLIEAAHADESSRQFEILMALFDLNPQHSGVLSSVLRQSQWRNASKPIKHIREAVLKQMFSHRGANERRMGDALGLSAKAIGSLSHRADTLEAIPGTDGVWRQGGGRRSEDDDRRSYDTDEGERKPISIASVRPEFIRVVDPEKHLSKEEKEFIVDAFPIIDWFKVLEKAGLDDFEMSIFHCLFGYDRGQSKAIAWYTNDGYDRKTVEATIKRVRRKLPKIREILISSSTFPQEKCPSSRRTVNK